MIEEPLSKLRAVVDRAVCQKKSFKVLEAGCGSSTWIPMGPNAYVVGVDISEKQLQRNRLLAEKIVGDIQRYVPQKADFDVVICWDVLEHLPHPNQAIHNLIHSIKPGGIVILAAPNLYSLKGLLAKFTPYWFHVWVYRHIIGSKDAGTGDVAPFRTFLRRSMSLPSVERVAKDNGLSVELSILYESPMNRGAREKYRLVGWKWHFVKFLVRLLSLGRVDAECSDWILVLKKTE
jgi:SAM-dependent methyltransferase